MKLILVCFWLAVLLGFTETGHAGGLKDDFYEQSCNGIEDKIRQLTWNLVARDFTIPARLLRMHFHDCFVRGCDASVLLDSTDGNAAEKSAGPNLSLRAFDVIDEIKEMVEATCPDTVSCADILALAARDAVSRQSGQLLWNVKTGRKDGRISMASEANANLPSPFSGFNTLLRAFNSKGLSLRDLVVLSGAHTIGVSHCNFFSPRVFNFTGHNDVDPSLDPGYAMFLRGQCRSVSNGVTFVGMDPGSILNFDDNYYRTVKSNRGLFVSDAALLTNEQSSEIVDELLNSNSFFEEFAQSMERLGQIGVLRGRQGEIRKKCNVVN